MNIINLRQNFYQTYSTVSRIIIKETGLVVVSGIGLITIVFFLKSLKDQNDQENSKETSIKSAPPLNNEEAQQNLDDIQYDTESNNKKKKAQKTNKTLVNTAFKEDNSALSAFDITDRDIKTFKRNPLKARIAFETDQENSRDIRRERRKLDKSQNGVDKLFFTLYDKIQINEEDDSKY